MAHVFQPSRGGIDGAVDVDRNSVRYCCFVWRRQSVTRNWPSSIPGTGSSYYFAEQSFLNHDKHWRYARLSKFIVGWASHLYYWIYPGVMVAVTGIFCGYVVGTLWPNAMSASNPGTLFMMVVAVVFTFGVAYIAHRGVTGSTAVNIAINVIQISALSYSR